MLWYRGDGQKTSADVTRSLPPGACVLESKPPGLFLVHAERSTLERAFTRKDGWVVADNNLVA